MPRYFFHVKDGKDLPDEEGTELPDMNAVRSEAIRASGECFGISTISGTESPGR